MTIVFLKVLRVVQLVFIPYVRFASRPVCVVFDRSVRCWEWLASTPLITMQQGHVQCLLVQSRLSFSFLVCRLSLWVFLEGGIQNWSDAGIDGLGTSLNQLSVKKSFLTF